MCAVWVYTLLLMAAVCNSGLAESEPERRISGYVPGDGKSCRSCCGLNKRLCPSFCPPCGQQSPDQCSPTRPCPFGLRCELQPTCLAIGCPPSRSVCVSVGPTPRPAPPRIPCANPFCAGPCSNTKSGPICVRPGPTITCANVRCAGPCRDTKSGPVCERPGQCPVNDLLARITEPASADRRDACQRDSVCPDRQKCCMYGVARQCVPACSRKCERTEQCVLEEETPCLSLPCRRQRRQASCQPLPPPLSCSTLDCPSDRVCVTRAGQPQCVLRPSPFPPTLPSSCANLCKFGQRCVEGPGGARCVSLTSPRPGVCPRDDQPSICKTENQDAGLSALSVVPEGSCRADSDCRDDWKCCRRGCNRRCLPPCSYGCSKQEQCKFFQVLCVRAPCPFDGSSSCQNEFPRRG